MRRNFVFSSESVSEGHPDKVADQISDAILDHFLALDAKARVAVETLVTTNRVVLAGEVKSIARVSEEDLDKLVRDVVAQIGYDQSGFSYKNLEISNYIHEQSSDISIGVDQSGVGSGEGAGDQGIMFGYASDETPHYMPSAIYYSHKMLKETADRRKQGALKGLLPDSKGQITLRYENGVPVECLSVVFSHQHCEDISLKDVENMLTPLVHEVMPKGFITGNTRFYINPTGKFVIGGPDGDAGLTGRKIIVDSYGGSAPHGGGAFSGKDSTKVDRSSAYMARYVAKNIVAAGLARECLVQLAYAIGVSYPLSVYVDTKGTSKVSEEEIENFITKNVDLSPKGIREALNLESPIFRPSATYGHFGRDAKDGYFTWEALDLVPSLKSYFNI